MESAIALCAGLARHLDDNGSLAEFHLDGAKVEWPSGPRYRAVETALAELPASIDWKRPRSEGTVRRKASASMPAIMVGYAKEFVSAAPASRLERRIWVDWGDGGLPPGVVRVGPGAVRAGEVRL